MTSRFHPLLALFAVAVLAGCPGKDGEGFDTSPGDTSPPDTFDTDPGDPGTTPSPCETAFFDPGEELPFNPDPVGDFTDSELDHEPTTTGPEIDITGYVSLSAECTTEEVTALKIALQCGDSEGRQVVCDGGANLEGGVLRVAVTEFAADLQLSSGTQSYIYAAVFDADGEAANNWVAQPPYDGDLYQGADHWYELAFNHNGGEWSTRLAVVDETQDVTATPSALRFVATGNRVYAVTMASEFAVDKPAWRGTAFIHDGAFSPDDRGADVVGEDGQDPLVVPDS